MSEPRQIRPFPNEDEYQAALEFHEWNNITGNPLAAAICVVGLRIEKHMFMARNSMAMMTNRIYDIGFYLKERNARESRGAAKGKKKPARKRARKK